MSNPSDGDLDAKLHLAIHAGETSEAFHMLRDRLRKVEASVAELKAINKRHVEELKHLGDHEPPRCADLHKTENGGEWDCVLSRGHDGDHTAGSHPSAVSWPRKVGTWSLSLNEWACGCELLDGVFELRDDSTVECLACGYVRPAAKIEKRIGTWDNPMNSGCWRCRCAAHQLRGADTPDCSMCGAIRPPPLTPPIPVTAPVDDGMVGTWAGMPFDWSDWMLWLCGCRGGDVSNRRDPSDLSCPECGYARPLPPGAKVGVWVEELNVWVCCTDSGQIGSIAVCTGCGALRPPLPLRCREARCVRDAGHERAHRDRDGCEWPVMTVDDMAALVKRMLKSAMAARGAFDGEWAIAAASKAVAGGGRNIALTQLQQDADHIADACPKNVIALADSWTALAIELAILKSRIPQ